MQRIDDNDMKMVAQLFKSPAYKRILTNEFDQAVLGLMTAGPDKVQQLQGRASLLKELLDLLNEQ